MVSSWSEDRYMEYSFLIQGGTKEAIAKGTDLAWEYVLEKQESIWYDWVFFFHGLKTQVILGLKVSHRWTGLRWHMRIQKWVRFPSENWKCILAKDEFVPYIVGSLHTTLAHPSIWFLCQIALIQFLVVWFSISSNTANIPDIYWNVRVYGSICM